MSETMRDEAGSCAEVFSEPAEASSSYGDPSPRAGRPGRRLESARQDPASRRDQTVAFLADARAKAASEPFGIAAPLKRPVEPPRAEALAVTARRTAPEGTGVRERAAADPREASPAGQRNRIDGTSGGGGGRGGGEPPLHKRFGDNDFRDVLTKGLAGCRRKLIVVAFFSFWTNVLILAVPIYLFNISDRVLTSRSLDTLVMLSVIIVGAVFGHVILDVVRRFMLMRIAVEVECRLGAPVLAAAAGRHRPAPPASSRRLPTCSSCAISSRDLCCSPCSMRPWRRSTFWPSSSSIRTSAGSSRRPACCCLASPASTRR